MYLVVGGLLLLLLATAGTTTAVRLRVTSIGRVLSGTLRPAQMSAADLIKAYVDEETGERGYLLTRDVSFLAPYNAGRQAATAAHGQLTEELAGDPASRRILSQVDAAAAQWQTRVIQPELSAASHGSLSGPAIVASVSLGRTLFDTLRTHLRELQDRINTQVGAALQDSSAAQAAANWVTIAAAVAALLLALIAVWQLHTSFAQPLNRLVKQVRQVSDGDIQQSVDVTGPLEVTTVGRSVEAMRTRILAENARSSAATRQVARYEEAERIARSLGDTVIRQLYTTSLALQSTASRHPATRTVLTRAIQDIDAALRDLQAAVFELTAAPSRRPLSEQLLDLVDQWEDGRGAAPEVQLAGSLDSDVIQSVAADVIMVVSDVVSAVARPAATTISLSTDGAELRLLITGGGAELAAPDAPGVLAGARHAAERLGGSCTVEQQADSVAVNWRIPVPAPESRHQ